MFISGESARAKVAEMKENGVQVITFTEEDVNALDRAFRSGQKIPAMKLTETQIKAINQNFLKYQDKQQMSKMLDMSRYLEGLSDTPEDRAIGKKRGECAQMLKSAGYSNLQINLLYPYIMEGKSADEIMKLFSKDSSEEEIENLLKMFG